MILVKPIVFLQIYSVWFTQVASLGAEVIWHLTRIATVTLPLTTIAHLSTGKIMDV